MFAFRILLFACILSAVPFSRTSRSDSDTPPRHAAATLEDLRAWVGESIARMEFEAAPAGAEVQALEQRWRPSAPARCRAPRGERGKDRGSSLTPCEKG